MLYLPADAQCDVHVRGYRMPRLADLHGSIQHTGLDGCTGGSQRCPYPVGKAAYVIKHLLRAYPTAHSDHDTTVLQSATGAGLGRQLLYETYTTVEGEIREVMYPHCALPRVVTPGSFHHSRTDRSHLRTAAGCDDGGHQIASEGRPYLEQPSRSLFDVQLRTVSCQPGVERSGQTRGHASSPLRRPDEQNGGMEKTDNVGHDIRTVFIETGCQERMFQHMHDVRPTSHQLRGYLSYMSAHKHGFDPARQLASQPACLAH